jgi:predicted NBD/HSP70 family sugar kinase
MATVSAVRSMNRRRILQAMITLRQASRIELAHVCGMSQPTVSRIVDELIGESILVEGTEPAEIRARPGESTRNGQVGRPSTLLQLDQKRPRFLVIHVGVGETHGALAPIGFQSLTGWTMEFSTPQTDGVEWAKRMNGALEAIDRSVELDAVALCLPGVIDESTGKVLLSPNLHWAETFDFAGALASLKFRTTVYVQEIRALALGQLIVEPEVHDFLHVDFGTGVGAAAVVNGQLYSGPLPLSGEIGHTPLMNNPRRCGCGGIGCLETLVGRRSIVAGAKEHHQLESMPAFSQQIVEHGIPNWFKERLEAAATVIASALNTLGLREVVISGYVNELPAIVAQTLDASIRNDAMWGRFGTVRCRQVPRQRWLGITSIAVERTMLALPAAFSGGPGFSSRSKISTST